MIAFVQGVIEDIAEDNVVLDVGGIGINVKISSSTAARLPNIGEEARLYTYTLVREDAFLLYGFLAKKDLDIFKLCITVNGIGPKGALAILSVMDADSLRFAIMTKNVKAISQAPGIGARTAERLILDLKDKIHVDDVLIGREVQATAEGNRITPQKQEAVEALVALGYGQTESIRAVNAISGIEDMDSGAVLKAALKNLV
ncbi:MAG: Holliday junction branch migration protein RuvA [Butyrivibrio sp.]|nr:Holliday junction branch migration protein RuvA [Muribaculum sp.]MCM1552866.1 Holliday junction branch migration protein RuvA [Butyrivibrio sp.]